MPAFLPEAPLISQELVNPIISHFALLAENSANVPKRLCSLVMKKQNKTEQNKQQQKNPPTLPTSILLSLGEEKHPQTTGLYLVIKPN